MHMPSRVLYRTRRAALLGATRVKSDQTGFTLIELLVSMSMFIIVLAAVLTTFDAISRDSANETERNIALTEATTGVAGMVQMIDQAYHVNGPTSVTSSDWIDVQVRLPANVTASNPKGDTRVLYNCGYSDPSSGYRDCVRYEVAGSCGSGCTAGTAPAGASGWVVVKRVINGTSSSSVFTNLATPSGSGSEITFGDVTIDTPAAGERATVSTYKHQVVLSNAFYIRQLDFAQ